MWKGREHFQCSLVRSTLIKPHPPKKPSVLQTLKHVRSCLHGAEGILEYVLVLVSEAVASVPLISMKYY